MITYHVGDASQPDLDGEVTIAHVLSTKGAYEKGFAQAVARRHPSARLRFKAWHAGDHDTSGTARGFGLGRVQYCAVGLDLQRPPWHRWVANMVAMRGLRSVRNPVPLDLDALDQCLRHLAQSTKGPVAMNRIGCGLAGGTWDQVEPLIEANLGAHDVHVYDLDGTPVAIVTEPEFLAARDRAVAGLDPPATWDELCAMATDEDWPTDLHRVTHFTFVALPLSRPADRKPR